jgi:hypothetical protein
MALVRKRTIQTERPPIVGEVSVNFLRIEGVAWSAQRIRTAVNLGFLDPEPLLFHSNEAEWTPFQTHHFSYNGELSSVKAGGTYRDHCA